MAESPPRIERILATATDRIKAAGELLDRAHAMLTRAGLLTPRAEEALARARRATGAARDHVVGLRSQD